MGIVAKNIIVGNQTIEKKKEEPKVLPSENSFTTIKRNIIEKPEETVSHYHHEKHGDLHKLINKKSDYLKDMLALEK
jgi:hypothetical protein